MIKHSLPPNEFAIPGLIDLVTSYYRSGETIKWVDNNVASKETDSLVFTTLVSATADDNDDELLSGRDILRLKSLFPLRTRYSKANRSCSGRSKHYIHHHAS